jgi:vacuolar-type H+-ATPase subunit F/Vma7
MSFGVRVLSRPAIGTGFALAGLRTTDVATPEAGTAQLRDLLSQPDVGVVLVEESIYDALPEDLRRILGKRPLPMVVPFPEPAWTERAQTPETYIVELLRQVIGYRVRLK